MNETERLIGLTAVFVLGIGAQWLGWRIHLPSIVLLLCFGFLAGPVTGLLDPDLLIGQELLFPIVGLSVAIILFEGGLSLKLDELSEIGSPLWGLLTVGVAVTWALSTLAAYFLLDFPFSLSLLLGAILVVTGPTVIGPLLSHVRPVGKVGTIAKWEGIIVDPIGAVLAVLVLQSIGAVHDADFWQATVNVVFGMLKTAVIGVVMGYLGTLPILFLLRRFLIPDFLQSPVLLMAVVGAFTASDLIQHESGLLTVTVMGILLANQSSVDVKHIIEFKENLRVLLISSLFILLAARLDTSKLSLLDTRVIWFVLLMILVVRPVSVLIGTIRSGLTWQEKVFLSWLAPRGIVAASVASVFALDLGESGEALIPVTFSVIVGTVVIYGVSLSRLAQWLKLASPNPQGVLIGSAHPAARAIANALKSAGFRVILVDSNRYNTNIARMEGLVSRNANVLSDMDVRDLNLGGIGRFLGMTRNDEVNMLAALRFTELFGRANVYQLSREEDKQSKKESSPQHLRGRRLFAVHATYNYLDQRFASGAVIKRTKLTEEFTYANFKSMYGDSALPLFVISESGNLTICTADNNISPKKGQTIIALVDPLEEVEKPTEPEQKEIQLPA